MAAQPVRALPEGGEWLYELKLDGYRALLLKNGSDIRILSRNEKDLTPMYPGIAAAGLRLKADQGIVDQLGEFIHDRTHRVAGQKPDVQGSARFGRNHVGANTRLQHGRRHGVTHHGIPERICVG